MILRLILIAVIAFAAFSLIKRLRHSNSGKIQNHGKLVACSKCGVHVPSSELKEQRCHKCR